MKISTFSSIHLQNVQISLQTRQHSRLPKDSSSSAASGSCVGLGFMALFGWRESLFYSFFRSKFKAKKTPLSHGFMGPIAIEPIAK